MAFKMGPPPYENNKAPVYHVDMEDGVMGKANNNGTIVLNKDIHPEESEQVIAHEEVHIDQMQRGDLNYDDDNVYWKGKTYPRNEMHEGDSALPWEVEAYKKVK